MTEVSDLQPDQPAGEALTSGQVALYLKAKNAERPCEACGGSEWRLHDEARDECATGIGLTRMDSPGLSGIKPTVTVICTGCAAVRSFVRAAVAQWVWENRRG